jgi:hypothetical protein
LLLSKASVTALPWQLPIQTSNGQEAKDTPLVGCQCCSAALGSMKGSNTKQRGHTTSGCASLSTHLWQIKRKDRHSGNQHAVYLLYRVRTVHLPQQGASVTAPHHPLTSFGTTMLRVNHELNTAAAAAQLRGPQHLSIQLTGPQQLHSRSSHTAAAVQPHRLW